MSKHNHRERLATTLSMPNNTGFTVAVWLHSTFNAVIRFFYTKILMILRKYLYWLFFILVHKEKVVFYNIQQALRLHKTFKQNIKLVGIVLFVSNFAVYTFPFVVTGNITCESADFIICTIAYNKKCVIIKQSGNVKTITVRFTVLS